MDVDRIAAASKAAPVGALAAREARWARRLELAQAMGAGRVLFTLTLRMPAPLRASGAYDDRARRLLEDLAAATKAAGMGAAAVEFRVGADGPEGYIAAAGESRAAKELAVRFEERHPWGELADVDVMRPDGVAIGRGELGLPSRACLVCGAEAALCVVGKAHSLEELSAKIEEILARPLGPVPEEGARCARR